MGDRDRVQYSYRSIREQLLDAGPRLALLHSESLLPQRAVQAVDELPPRSEAVIDSILSLYLATAAFEYAMEEGITPIRYVQAAAGQHCNAMQQLITVCRRPRLLHWVPLSATS